MKKIILFSSLLFSCVVFSQNYEWKWAKSGGGSARGLNESQSAYWYTSEQIFDIVTDNQNNNYYLATITQGNTKILNEQVTTYNNVVAGNDIAIFATNCEGEYLWSRIIGGQQQDTAYKLALDTNGGIYVAVNVLNIAYEGSNLFPPRFGDDDVLPYTPINNSEQSEAWNTSFLLKYNTQNGTLLWRKNLQGSVNQENRNACVYQIMIDTNNILHMMVGYSKGTHLNNAITVPNTFTNTLQYYIIKFNDEGVLQGSPLLLNASGIFLDYHTHFRYDQNLNRYYIAGSRNNGGGTYLDLQYNNTAVQGRSYVLAINAGSGQEIWRKDMGATDTQFDDSRIYGIEVDENSDLYIGGKFFNTGNSDVLFGNHILSNELTGNIPFILKMNSSGTVQWSKVPTAYIDPLAATGGHMAYGVAINGNEVALATQGRSHVWGNYSINRPQGHRTDPVLLRFNKQNGNVIGLHDIMGVGGYDDAITTIGVDNDGNYIVGGYYRFNLFSNNINNINPLTNSANNGNYTDFFIAKLASSECGTVSNEDFEKINIKLYPNPTSGKIYIETDEILKTYEVYNIVGQRLLRGTFMTDERFISLENMSSGTYFIRLQTQSGTVVTEKIIKN